VYIGDLKSYVYAVDAQTGRGLWTSRVDDHYGARITGAATVYDGKVFVPLAKWEANSARFLSYACCTVRGSVTALDANTGKQIWKHYTIEEPPKPVRVNSAGTQLYAPSGGTVWNAPTVDPKLNVIYYGTGEATSHPAGLATDAILAIDIKTGKRLWSYQGTANDAYIIGCTGANVTENCPENVGPDNDIGASPILMTLSTGKRAVIAAQKMGDVFALDPDNNGNVLWRVKVGPGGIVWGGAAEGDRIYYGLTGGGVIAINATNGERIWYSDLQPPAGRGRAANGAAVTAMPGVVFSGARTGIFYALSTTDGTKLWEFDTARDVETNNRVAAHGGTMGSAGSTVANGMVFVGSGYNFGGADRTGNVILAFSPN
jgi:polyvinyl alcohol dehydrogenase (cytochrome)